MGPADSIKNSRFPSAPSIGDGSSPMRSNPTAARCALDFFDDARVNGGIADDAALADLAAPRLELRLDQANRPARPAASSRWQHREDVLAAR